MSKQLKGIIITIFYLLVFGLILSVLLINKSPKASSSNSHNDGITKCEHEYNDWVTIQQSNCINPGIEKHVCSICGHEETKNIGYGEHNYIQQNEFYSICSICGDYVVTEPEGYKVIGFMPYMDDTTNQELFNGHNIDINFNNHDDYTIDDNVETFIGKSSTDTIYSYSLDDENYSIDNQLLDYVMINNQKCYLLKIPSNTETISFGIMGLGNLGLIPYMYTPKITLNEYYRNDDHYRDSFGYNIYVVNGWKDKEDNQCLSYQLFGRLNCSSEVDLVTYQYYLEQATQSDSNTVPSQTLLMTPKENGSQWVMFYQYNIPYGQCFRVKIVKYVNGIENEITYNSNDYVWGNEANNNGSFVYWTGSGNVTWDNAIQDLGNGLYYVQL